MKESDIYEDTYVQNHIGIRRYLFQRTRDSNEASAMDSCAAWYCFKLDWSKGF